mmetsp:Transcript_37786/g.121477  ORF Transcript_37786/g.121477 Transcript_37786/m.121477 type:complete len:417 (+) Transcript_37786:486-1736(+)
MMPPFPPRAPLRRCRHLSPPPPCRHRSCGLLCLIVPATSLEVVSGAGTVALRVGYWWLSVSDRRYAPNTAVGADSLWASAPPSLPADPGSLAQLGILPLRVEQQSLRRALLHHPPRSHDGHPVKPARLTQPVRSHHHRAPEPEQRRMGRGVGAGVDARRRLIAQQSAHHRPRRPTRLGSRPVATAHAAGDSDQPSRQREKLPLPIAQPGPCRRRLQAEGQRRDPATQSNKVERSPRRRQRPRRRLGARLRNPISALLAVPPAARRPRRRAPAVGLRRRAAFVREREQVEQDRALQEQRLLCHHPHRRPHISKRGSAQIDAVEAQAAAVDRVEPNQRPQKRRLATPRPAAQRHLGPSRYRQPGSTQHRRQIRAVPQDDIPHLNHAEGPRVLGRGAVPAAAPAIEGQGAADEPATVPA